MALAHESSRERLRLWLRMLRATRHVEAQIRERFRRDFSVTLPQFDVLAALARQSEGMRMSEISRYLRVSNGNVTGIVERLVADGLVSRERAPDDGRAAVVALTEAGKSTFERMAAAHAMWIEELMEPVSLAEAQAASTVLARVYEVNP